MNKAGLFHEMSLNYVYAPRKGCLTFKLMTAKDDIKAVNLFYIDKYLSGHGQAQLDFVPMKKVATTAEHDYFEVELTIETICLRYFFEVADNESVYGYYLGTGYEDRKCIDLFKMFDVPQQAREEEIFDIPQWMKEGIVYQIFPERFYRGKDRIEDTQYEPWDTEVTWKSRLGGSLKGVSEKLNYLNDLGVNIIYLNPVFKSISNHKYDTQDYFQIDPDFGTKEDFKEMITKAHELGMKVVVDGVFNHCGYDFFAFQDVILNEEESSYKDWFHIYSFPITSGYRKKGVYERPSYNTFGYYGGMPKLNLENAEVRDYILKVADYWTTEFKVDGWRLDASDEVSFDFWRQFRKHLKGISSEIGIIGEIWYDSTQWLLGDQYDSVMNYKFRMPLVEWIAEESIPVSRFDNWIQFTRARYKKPIQLGLWNLLDSHDTERFLSLCHGEKNKFKLALILQFTLQGNPVIYYGDEVGMMGGKDPDCRRGMVWEEENQDLEILALYKRLIELRRENKELIYGEYTSTLVDDDKNILIYKRTWKDKECLIVINRGDTLFKMPREEELWDLINNKKFDNEVQPGTGVLLKKIK